MPWWMDNNLRMIQLNLRDIDAAMDVPLMIETALSFHANALMVGAGGITSFFPTELPFQTPSPYLTGDTLGDIVRLGHQAGLRVIARFDFSKTHERLFDQNPGWYYRSAAGQPLRYNDTVQTCVNGAYQREKSLEIIGEVLRKYPVDGIFFNMFGYQTRDYSGVYHGICHCDACKSRFRAWAGADLPATEGEGEPHLPAYRAFQERTVKDMLDLIADHVKAINPEVAICTYHHHRVDIIRDESNSAVDRPYPFWLYSGSENTQSVEDTWQDKTSANVAINAVDIPYRFQGVSPHLTRIRLYQALASGSQLDWCIIGVFEGYPDRASFDAAREVFAYHEQNQALYGHLRPAADIALIRPMKGSPAHREYLGLFRALKEAHLPFKAIRLENPAAVAAAAENCRVMILPGIAALPEEALSALRHGSCSVVATGAALSGQGKALEDLLGIAYGRAQEPIRSAYLLTQPKETFASFPERDWVYLDGTFNRVELRGAAGLLPLVAPSSFGPPERCFGHEQDPEAPGATLFRRGDCLSAALPWNPGALYYQHGYTDHRDIFLDVLGQVYLKSPPLITDAPPCVEVTLNHLEEGKYILHLINLSGFNGTSFEAPLPIREFSLRLGTGETICRFEPLNNQILPARLKDGLLTIAELGAFGAYLLHTR